VGDGVDELDVALLDALHLNPLASFEELGMVLEVSSVTVARRWRRLVSTGRAWVSSAPGPQLPMRAALFEAECQPGAATAVASEFAAIPQVFSVNITTGQDNLYAFVVAADQPLLAALVVDTLPAIAGLNRVQSALMTQLFSGTRWRLGGLSPDQVRAVIWTEEALRADKQTRMMLVPANSFSGAEGLRDLLFVPHARGDHVEGACQEDRAVLIGQRHRLLELQLLPLGGAGPAVLDLRQPPRLLHQLAR